MTLCTLCRQPSCILYYDRPLCGAHWARLCEDDSILRRLHLVREQGEVKERGERSDFSCENPPVPLQ